MTKEIISLDEAIMSRLASAVKTKTGSLALDEEGNQITPTTAMAMSLVSKAMQGDVSSISFIRNMQRSQDTSDAQQARQRYEQRLAEAIGGIRSELEREDLYVGQDLEIEQLAHVKLQLDRIQELMAQPDYDVVVTRYDKSGSASHMLNPLNERHDRLQKQYLTDLKELRTDAMRRKICQKNIKRK